MPRKKQTLNPDETPGIFSSMVQDFLTYVVDIKGESKATQKSYKYAFKHLAEYMLKEQHTGFEEITFSMMTTKMVENYVKWLDKERKNSNKTINARLAAFGAFAKYAVNHNFEAASRFQRGLSAVDHRKPESSEMSYFTVAEVRILFDLPKHNTISGRRDATLLPFMFATAIRCEEVCDLQVKHVTFLEGGRVRITIHGKGRKVRTVTICEDVAFALRRYMRYRHILEVPEAFVFNTQNSPKMSGSCVADIFAKYVKLAREQHPDIFQFKHYSPHSMRHTTAVCMLEAGVPLPVIKVFLGHSSLATTEIYAKITQPAMDQEISDWNKSFWGSVTDDVQNAVGQESEGNEGSEDEKNRIPDFLR